MQVVHHQIEKSQTLHVYIENCDVRAETFRHAQRVHARSSAADHDHAPRQNSRHSAQQHSAAAIVFGQKIGSHHHRHAAGDLAHRFQQRQSVVDLDRLICNGGHPRFQQSFSERFARSEMQIGEKDLALVQQRQLCLARLFDFHNQVGTAENFFR